MGGPTVTLECEEHPKFTTFDPDNNVSILNRVPLFLAIKRDFCIPSMAGIITSTSWKRQISGKCFSFYFPPKLISVLISPHII
jgi:hypothetical protein